MRRLHARQIFAQTSLARLAYDEPVSTRDADTGIELHYRFEHATGGRLSLTGGLLRDRVIQLGCDPDDLNLLATLMIDGLKHHLA